MSRGLDMRPARRPAAPPGDVATRCPLCDGYAYPWAAVRQGSGERIFDRCEECGTAIDRSRAVDLAAEWEAIAGADPIPNRGSLQAWIGGEGWAGLDRAPGALVLTRRGLELLAERNGRRVSRVRTPLTRRGQIRMWQTLLNGLTIHPNFAREVVTGRLRPGSSQGRFRFWADAVASVLAAPLVAIVSVPLELVAVLFGRGGELAFGRG